MTNVQFKFSWNWLETFSVCTIKTAREGRGTGGGGCAPRANVVKHSGLGGLLFLFFFYVSGMKQPAFCQGTAVTRNKRNQSIKSYNKSSGAAGDARLKSSSLFPPTSIVWTQKEFLQELNSPSGPSSDRTKSAAVSVSSINYPCDPQLELLSAF